MEQKLVLYMHAGSGNHGCEAIVNSLCHMVSAPGILVSYRKEEDERYSLGRLCEVVQERSFAQHKLAHVFYYGYRKLTGDEESGIRYRYRQVFRSEPAPLAISIGGDNYCYENMLRDLRLTNSAFGHKGIKTVLLGCSIEPELLQNRQILEDLSRYHTIIARESITYEALKKAFEGTVSPKIHCYPDPAFTLKPQETSMPEGFAEGNTVGINISPLIRSKELKLGIAMDCYRALIRGILRETDMQIALIPHVVWAGNDDRKPLHELYQEFTRLQQGKYAGRILEVTDRSCTELKEIIGKCRFFVGARTHATIAAYSSCVPTLVVGYSVKARGIARDLFGTEEHYVMPVQSLQQEADLLDGFHWISEHEQEIRQTLTVNMPDYQQKALQTGREVDRLWEEFSRQQGI